MKRLIDLTADEARSHFLKGSSYFNGDFPKYISFEPILNDTAAALGGQGFNSFQSAGQKAKDFPDVNYSFVANKDGRFAWRPYELMHPAIYVSLVNLICTPENWSVIVGRFKDFETGIVTCCSNPVVSDDHQSDQATQVRNWWQAVEQESLKLSLDFSHVLHTDVIDCYGSLYTHSISWALHGIENSKSKSGKLLGDKIDFHICSGRYGQTNGISQGSVLMDFIAELVLGYVDEKISRILDNSQACRVLRYRDDYRIFANSDVLAEEVLKKVSDSLRSVGMRLGISKTYLCTNVIEGSIKPDKLAGIDLQDLGDSNAKTLQKQLLRLHSFGRRFPNSGALRRLISELHSKVVAQTESPEDLEVQVAIATDIAVVSPLTFPAIAGILSHLISLTDHLQKEALWKKVYAKMSRVPYNGYLQVWLQRVTKPLSFNQDFISNEPLCQIVNGEPSMLWNSQWIASDALKKAMAVTKLVVAEAGKSPEVMVPEEVELFTKNAILY